MTRLEAQHLDCAYDGSTVVKNLSLTAQPGEVLILIGPNGAGKSTLLRAMARMLHPAHGKVLLVGRDLWSISSQDSARQIAFAPQAEKDSWPATVQQMVALGRAPHRGWLLPLAAHDREVINKTLELVEISHLKDRPITDLSGGEQQRVILARVLTQEPSVLILDEPTSHLDLKHQVNILGLVQRLAHREKLSVIISLHDLNLAALYADRLALLSRGELLAVGTPSEVLTSEQLSRVYGVPVVVTRHPLSGAPLVMPDIHRVEKENDG